MCPPTIPDIGPDCNEEDICISLEKITRGLPLPGNVIDGVNPYCHAPENLPKGIWYLICTKENENLEHRNWKVKGESCRLFSNSVITGWRTTHEFFEGYVPHERRTDWLMQEYWITRKGRAENIMEKEASSLCRVFLGGEGLDHGKQQRRPAFCIASETCIPSSDSILQNGDNENSNGSTRDHEVDKDDEIGQLTVTGSPLNHGVEISPEIDYFSRGDYLELLDFTTPASHSSSSDNSSRMSMSSDEYFDSLALLRDLESDSSKDLEKKDANCKLNVTTPQRRDDLVILPVSPGPLLSIEENMPTKEEARRMDPIIPCPDNGYGKGSPHKGGNQGLGYRNEGPSSICHDVGTSSDSQTAPQDGKRKASNSRMKKLKKKYLCFVPFYFLF